jgi:two-component system sensor histidine kinase AlgZ
MLVRLILTILVCAAVAVTIVAPGSSLSAVARSFRISLVYAACIGIPAYLSLTRLGPIFGKMRAPWNWVLFIAACVALAVGGCLLSVGVLAWAGVFPRRAYWRIFLTNIRLSLVITVAFGAGMFLYESMRYKLQRAKLEEERARFASLESRVHPHFLFNTLNSISALIREDPRKAERTVEQLSALLRYSLDLNTSRLSPLRQEMRIVTDYLDIEKTRFGDRLRYAIDVPAQLEDLEMPPMAVQTLVENSIKHAISRNRKGGEVRIAARMIGDRFEVEVSDDGPGFQESDIKEGHGLDSLRARLASVFAEDAALRISSEAGRTTVTISLPRKRVLV